MSAGKPIANRPTEPEGTASRPAEPTGNDQPKQRTRKPRKARKSAQRKETQSSKQRKTEDEGVVSDGGGAGAKPERKQGKRGKPKSLQGAVVPQAAFTSEAWDNFQPKRNFTVESPEHLYILIAGYLAACAQCDEPLTITGLALYCGFHSREELNNLGARRPEFALPVKRARTVIEHQYELRVATVESGGGVAGAIFALKNMGWTDKTEVEVRAAVLLRNVKSLPDDVLARISAGERPEVVLAELAERAEVAGLLGPGKGE